MILYPSEGYRLRASPWGIRLIHEALRLNFPIPDAILHVYLYIVVCTFIRVLIIVSTSLWVRIQGERVHAVQVEVSQRLKFESFMIQILILISDYLLYCIHTSGTFVHNQCPGCQPARARLTDTSRACPIGYYWFSTPAARSNGGYARRPCARSCMMYRIP